MKQEPRQQEANDESIDYTDAPEMKHPVLLWSGPYSEFLKQQRLLREQSEPQRNSPMPKIREINGTREWLNSRGVWQGFPSEEELREMPPVKTGIPPVAVGLENFLRKRRKRSEA
jgi:hypothetical protein